MKLESLKLERTFPLYDVPCIKKSLERIFQLETLKLHDLSNCTIQHALMFVTVTKSTKLFLWKSGPNFNSNVINNFSLGCRLNVPSTELRNVLFVRKLMKSLFVIKR